jgi:hypothetical protein
MGRTESPVCQFCGYSLEGLTKLVCPECGQQHVPPPPPPPPPSFLDPVARPHVVCTINSVLIVVAFCVGFHQIRRWDWQSGAVVASFANLLLFGVLLAMFDRWRNTVGASFALVLVLLTLFLSVLVGWPGIGT